MTDPLFDHVSVVIDKACPKGSAFLVGPPNEDGEREFVAVVGIVHRRRFAGIRSYLTQDVRCRRWVWWLIWASIFLNAFAALVRWFGG